MRRCVLLAVATLTLVACSGRPSKVASPTTVATATTVAPPTTVTTAQAPARPTVPTVVTNVAGQIGLPVRARHIVLTVTSLIYDPCTGTSDQALPGKTFLIVSFRLQNVDSPDVVGFGALEWSLFDTAGNSLPSALETCRPRPDNQSPRAGQTIESSVAFQVPGNARLSRLTFYGGGGGPQIDYNVEGR